MNAPVILNIPHEPVLRVGKYMHTSNGRKYWPMDPRPDEVHIEVIAHHLATRCRYNGATQHPSIDWRIFYSVAEHSVYVALFLILLGAPIKVVKQGLLHDGSESYNGDLIRPLKYDAAFAEPFKKVEELNERAVCEAFDLPYPFDPLVKMADEAVTTAEVAQIIVRSPSEDWTTQITHDPTYTAPFEIAMLSPHNAKGMFLDFYRRLKNENHPKTTQEIAEFLDYWSKRDGHKIKTLR